jgi:hypothetical protein
MGERSPFGRVDVLVRARSDTPAAARSRSPATSPAQYLAGSDYVKGRRPDSRSTRLTKWTGLTSPSRCFEAWPVLADTRALGSRHRRPGGVVSGDWVGYEDRFAANHRTASHELAKMIEEGEEPIRRTTGAASSDRPRGSRLRETRTPALRRCRRRQSRTLVPGGSQPPRRHPRARARSADGMRGTSSEACSSASRRYPRRARDKRARPRGTGVGEGRGARRTSGGALHASV